MKKPEIRTLIVLIFALAALLLTAGCGSRSESSPAGAETTGNQGLADRAEPGETTEILDMRTGLDRLNSYQAVLTLRFEGTSAGQPQAWTRSYRLQYSSGGDNFRINSIERDSTPAGAGPSRRFTADVYGYRLEMRDAEECTLSIPDPSLSMDELWDPVSQLHAVSGAHLVGKSSVNGMDADHFSLDAGSLGLDGLADASGEMWVDSAGGMVLKYLLSLQAGPDYFGEGTEGTLSWMYELQNINQAFPPDLPAECRDGTLVWLPILPGAEITTLSARSISLQTALEPQQVLEHYQGLLEPAGWVLANNMNDFNFFGDDTFGDYQGYDEDFDAYDDTYEENFNYGEDWQDDDPFFSGGLDDSGVKTFMRGSQRLTLVFARESENLVRVVIQLEEMIE